MLQRMIDSSAPSVLQAAVDEMTADKNTRCH